MNDLVLFGPPGAGKGTQGALLADRLGLLRLSTGDVLRDAVKRGTKMGVEAQRYMNAGELVPDEVILGIVNDYLGAEAKDTGVIFDGFPRTIPQAERLDALLGTLCGAVYNIYFEAPRDEGRCDACGNPLTMRPDDDLATVQRRLDVYRQQTAPLLDYYEASPTTVHRLDGDRAVDDVQADLMRLLQR
jgi:adenylate kinase